MYLMCGPRRLFFFQCGRDAKRLDTSGQEHVGKGPHFKERIARNIYKLTASTEAGNADLTEPRRQGAFSGAPCNVMSGLAESRARRRLPRPGSLTPVKNGHLCLPLVTYYHGDVLKRQDNQVKQITPEPTLTFASLLT